MGEGKEGREGRRWGKRWGDGEGEGTKVSLVESVTTQVDTVKRLCTQNLITEVFVIQLKRFDYNWKRSG